MTRITLHDITTRIRATELHAHGLTGHGVGIALIDTGVARVDGLDRDGQVLDGPDLSLDVLAGATPHRDTNGHGTHMASLMVADGAGMTGVAPGAHLVNVRVADRDGTVDVTQVTAAVRWVAANAAELGIGVIALAYGTQDDDPAVHQLYAAIDAARAADVLVVVAAGNQGPGTGLDHPATHPGVLAVGATDVEGHVAPYSSRGTADRTPDLVAPGSSIIGLRAPGSAIDVAHPAARDGDHGFVGTGTSQAAAIVAGAAALLRQARPHLSAGEVMAIMTATAAPVAGDPLLVAGGSLDLAAAVTASAVPARQSGSAATTQVSSSVLSGRSLNGHSWSGHSWSGHSWSGHSWSGHSWS